MFRLDSNKIAGARSALEIVLTRHDFFIVPDFVMTTDNLNGLLNDLAT
jgi:hypothetical protein